MMKTLLKSMFSLLCLLAFGTVSTQAQTVTTKDTVAYSLVVVSNAQTTNIMLRHHPVITIADNKLVVKSDSVDIAVALADVDNYHLADVTYQVEVPTAIQQVSVPAFRGGAVTGLQKGEVVNIYSIDGKQIQSVVAGSDGIANINLSSLAKNVYILHTPSATYKITNK